MSASAEIKGSIEVRKVNGEIDEIVCDSCTFHLEQMDTGCWWIGIDAPGGQSLRVILSNKHNAKIKAFAEFEYETPKTFQDVKRIMQGG